MAVKLYYFGLDRIMPTNCKETSTHINVLVLGRGLSDIKQLNGYGPGSSAGSTLLPTTPCTFLSMALSAVCLLRIAGFRDLTWPRERRFVFVTSASSIIHHWPHV